MSTKFFTNNDDNTLLRKFEAVFSYNPKIHHFDALVGYFRSSGYFRVRPFLDNVSEIRILVGINIDNLLDNAYNQGFEFFKNDERTKEEFIKDLKKDIELANYDKETEDGILQFFDDLIAKKIQLRAHPDKKIHAKLYILRPQPFNQNTLSLAITGSSNFTDAGLGSSKDSNYEFNVQLNDYDEVKFATDEFEKLWAESVELLPIDLQKVKKQTYLHEEITPFELYIKLLIDYFDKNIDYDPNSISDLPKSFKRLSYQVDAVNEGYNMLLQHNGFVLADVVGLGKTVIATMVAKKFLMENGKDNTKILVVYPPAVEKNWKNTFKYFNIDKYAKFITNGSLHKILENNEDFWAKEEYDLIIVDEAHKFRNHTTGVFKNLQLICKSARENIGNVKGSQKKVILVTATPLNNKPDDIFYQIQMFQDARRSTLPITNLTSFFSPLMEQYKALKRYDEDLDIEKLREIYGKIRKNVIEPITIRRTRTDLENIEEYKADLLAQGILFPKVNPPSKLEYVLDQKLNELFFRTVFILTDKDKLSYARYQAISGLKTEIQNKFFENAETVSKSLAFIMKTMLIKRLESSFSAFKKSLENFQLATLRMIDMFEKDKIFIAPDLDINKLIEKGWSDEQIEQEIEKLSENNPKNNVFHSSDFEPDFVKGLIKDLELLNELVSSWSKITVDPKMDVFLEKLENEFLSPAKNKEGKLVIFSESKDTVVYLEEALKKKGRKDVLVISADNRKNLYDVIVNNFDANIEDNKKVNDYSIIITTEVLAEGVNLHRSNVIVHYDTPWNSTKLMQRIGRVNRIGTKATEIYNYIFYPSAQGDSQINLNRTAFMKIQAFHTAFGEDNQVFSTDEILDEVKLYNTDNQFKEAEDERLKYLFFLRKFKKENAAWFEQIRNMPLKSSVGRNSSEINKPLLKNGTAAFLRTSNKQEFYWIDSEGKPNEIPPVEAFRIFEADKMELNCDKIPNHHQQVKNALKSFENTGLKIIHADSEVEAFGAVAKGAKKFLSDLRANILLNEQQKLNLANMIKLIDRGKFTTLAGDVNKLLRKKLPLPSVLKSLDELSKVYSVSELDNSTPTINNIEKPILVISESFK
jgi:SNF2 family DNA or RNA helicase